MIQTRRVVLVLVSVLIVVTQFCRSSFVVGQVQGPSQGPSQDVKDQNDHPKCLADCENKKATSFDMAFSIMGYIASAFVMVSPWPRVNREVDYRQEDLAKDRWFMAFLGIMTQDYVAWAGYSFKKCYCDVSVYMIISSIVGAVISCSCFFMGLVRDIGRVTKPNDKGIFTVLFVATGAVIYLGSHDRDSGTSIMIGTLVAQACRAMGTDYTQFSGYQFIVSLLGSASSFLRIYHPHHALAQPFQTTSYALGWIRVLEIVWWIVLHVRSSQS